MYRTLDVGAGWTTAPSTPGPRRRAGEGARRAHRAGEVEAALATHPAVRAAATVARAARQGAGAVSWLPVRREGGRRPAAPSCATTCARACPRRWCPARSRGSTLSRAPPAASSTAAPWPIRLRPPPRAGHPAPARRWKTKLAAIWADALSLPRLGIHDDFFDLGGNSITASRLAARVRKEMGRELPLAALLRAPTVAGLARVLRAAAPPCGRR